MLQYKRCTRCGEVKSVSDFHKKGGGLQPRCKRCACEISHLWITSAHGRVRHLTTQRKYRTTPKGHSVTMRRYRLKREEMLCYGKERYYKLQEQFGWHGDVNKMVGCFSFIQALETAEIVEI